MAAPQFNEDFMIPDKFVGLVIGRGGEQIKRMQMESGCKIRIESEGNGSMERSCRLTGSQTAIEEAKRMLNDIIQRGMSRENGGGQQGGAPRGGNYGGQQGGYGGGYQQRQQQGGEYGGNQGGFQRY